MSILDESRREALKIIGAIGGTCAYPFGSNELYGQQVPVTPPQHVHQHAAPPQRPPAVAAKVKPGYFTEPDFEIITRLADLIIPATDTPGAVGAGVPAYVDSVVGANKALQETIRNGIAALDELSRKTHQQGFLSLTEDQQIALLTPWSQAIEKAKPNGPGERFFYTIKSLTADGYYTSYTGLMEELQYKGNAVLERFPEPVVPEH